MEAFIYNALLFAADAVLLSRLRKRPGFWNSVWVLLLGGAGPLLLAVLGVAVGQKPYPMMNLLAWGVFLHTGVLLAGTWLIHRGRFPEAARLAGVLGVAVTFVAIDVFLIEPHWFEVTHYTVTSQKLDRRLRVVVLADIQTDKVGPYERRVIERALAEEPDLILMPGDYLQVNRREFLRERARFSGMLSELGFEAPLGVVAVGGNTDHHNWPALFEGLPVKTVKVTETMDLGELTVTGLAVRESFQTNLKVPPNPDFHIVVGHSPDFALSETVDADLLVAGHSHGGQVRLPFFGPPITFSQIPRDWTDGLHEIRPGTWLSVSRGIGMERGAAPRLRFLCRPEIVVIDLKPA